MEITIKLLILPVDILRKKYYKEKKSKKTLLLGGLCDIISSARKNAPIAQLDRAFDYGSKGYGFDSFWVRHL